LPFQHNLHSQHEQQHQSGFVYFAAYITTKNRNNMIKHSYMASTY
jgi:hypothetical protein